MKYNYSKLTTFLVFIAFVPLILAYTEAPGIRKGIMFRDAWNRTWFLTAFVRVSTPIEEAAGEYIGKAIVLDVTELRFGLDGSEYTKGSIQPDVACQSSSEALDISIRPVYFQDDSTIHIPALEICIQNQGNEELRFGNNSLRICLIEEDGLFPFQHGLLDQLAYVQCAGTQFEFNQPDWDKQPKLIPGETHKLIVPLVKYRILNRTVSEELTKMLLSSSSLSLSEGKYQVVVSYFNDYANIRVISNAIEFRVKDKETSNLGVDPTPKESFSYSEL